MNSVILIALYLTCIVSYCILYIIGVFTTVKNNKLYIILSFVPVIGAFILTIIMHHYFNIAILIIIFVSTIISLLNARSY